MGQKSVDLEIGVDFFSVEGDLAASAAGLFVENKPPQRTFFVRGVDLF